MGLDSQLTESLFVGVPGPESEAHEYAFEMYAQGQKYNIVVDDEVPIFNPGTDVEYAIFAESKDHIMWGPILEKAYAKFVGSYEKIAKGGTATEAIRAITGFPGFLYPTHHTSNLWEIINAAIIKQDIVTCSTHLKSTKI